MPPRKSSRALGLQRQDPGKELQAGRVDTHVHVRAAKLSLAALHRSDHVAQTLHSRLHTRDTTLAHNDGQQCVMFTRRLRHAREPGNVSNGSKHKLLRVLW